MTSLPLRVAAGLVISLLLCGLQLALWEPFIAPYVWFLFFPCIFLSGWVAGSVGALTSTAINLVLVWYFFIPPRFAFLPISTGSIAVMTSYAIMGALVAWFFEKLREAQARSGARLSESEIRFEATFDQAAVGIALVGPDGRWLQVNRRLCQILGYTEAELLATNFQQLTYPDDLDNDLDFVRRMLAHEIATYTMQKRYLRKNGSILWANLTVSMVGDEDGKPSYFISVVEDIDELKRKEASVLRLNRALRLRAECSRVIGRAHDEKELLQLLCRELVQVADYRLVWVGYVQQDAEKSVEIAAQFGVGDGYLNRAHVSWSEADPRGCGPFGTAIRTGAPQLNWNFTSDPALTPWREAAAEAGFKWASSFPLNVEGHIIGALTIYAAEEKPVNDEEAELLQELVRDLAHAIAAQRYRANQKETAARLERSLLSGLEAIAYTLEMRDPYTAGHQQRVARLSAAIAKKLDLSDFDIEGIKLAASVHDIGKIRVPLEILTKPRRLTPLEYDYVKTHVAVGYEILRAIEFPWPIAEMVRQHHERVDGGGYPRGLGGDDILLGAKIISVADVVESMASDRPYRAALGVDAAMAELAKERGRGYDPAVCDACVSLFEGGFSFEN